MAVQNFAVCKVRCGRRLVGAPVDAIMVHYVLAGTMHMDIPGQPSIVCGPGCVALIPPGMEPSMAPRSGPAEEVIGIEHATINRNGLLVFDAAEGGVGDLRLVAGIVMASVSGSFGLLDKLRVPSRGHSPYLRDGWAQRLTRVMAEPRRHHAALAE